MARTRRISMRESAAIITFTTLFGSAPFYLIIGSWGLPIGFFLAAALVGGYFKYQAGGLAAGFFGVVALIWNVEKVTHLPFWAAALVFVGSLIGLVVLLYFVLVAKKRFIDDRREDPAQPAQ